VIHRVLVGGTASGKKTLAVELFRRHGLRPLSMDSMKVHRGMDIGTDKPSAALRADTGFGLLDLVGHDERFSAGRWIEHAAGEASRCPEGVLFAGGTPLYLRLLLRGIFPGPPADDDVRAELHALWDRAGEDAVRRELARVDPVAEARLLPGDRKRVVRAIEVHRITGRPITAWQSEDTRPPIAGRFLVAALRTEPGLHGERIVRRVDAMLAAGLLDEVRGLLARAPFAPEPGRSIGYAEAVDHLAGRLDAAAMRERIVVRTRQLVRKQRIFLASFPEIRWVDVGEATPPHELVQRVEAALELG